MLSKGLRSLSPVSCGNVQMHGLQSVAFDCASSLWFPRAEWQGCAIYLLSVTIAVCACAGRALSKADLNKSHRAMPFLLLDTKGKLAYF